MKKGISSAVAIQHEQMVAFIRLAYEMMDHEQMIEMLSRWRAVCADKGWKLVADDDDAIDPETEKAIERVLKRATEEAG